MAGKQTKSARRAKTSKTAKARKSASAHQPVAPDPKQWTVMVYLAGDNNLDSAGVVDLKEMKQTGSTDHVNVIAQFDRSGSHGTTKRYYLHKGGTLPKDVVADLGETNTGDPDVLKRFLEWGFKDYPAQHYLVVLWNHGAGWDDEDIYRSARKTLKLSVRRRGTLIAGSSAAPSASVSIRRIRAIGIKPLSRALFSTSITEALRPGNVARAITFDDTSKDFLDNLEMKRVFTWARTALSRKIDILGMDACLMSMAEVHYQVRDCVQFAVGSEEVEPGDGWPYHKILSRLAAKPNQSPETLAATIVTEYLASYSASAGVTQSACNLGKATALARAIDRLAVTLRAKLGDPIVRAAVIQSRAQVQSYDVADYIDLHDFCDLLAGASSDAHVRAACEEVKDVIHHEFVVQSGYKGSTMKQSNGCAIYFPQKAISSLYARLDFTKDTAWDEFLASYLDSLHSGRRAAVVTEADTREVETPGS